MSHPLYLDTAATGIISKSSLETSRKYDQLMLTSPSSAFHSFLENDYASVQELAANFIGVAPDRMSFTPNFSYAFSILLASVKPHKQRVLVLESDYPSILLPLQLQKFNVTKLVSANGFSWSIDDIESTIKSAKIEVFALSHVQYLTGYKSNLKAIAEICAKHNVVLIVDATQSLGAIPIHFDELGIDVLIASNYKWMNAGFGSAVICFKKDFIQHFPPAIAGYGSLKPVDGNMIYEPSATSYFPGHMNPSALLMVGAALQEKLAMGIQKIEQHNMDLMADFIERIKSIDLELLGPKTIENRSSFFSIKASPELHKHLADHGIQSTFRNNTIRIGFHFTNKKEDVFILLKVLDSFIR